MCFIVVHFDYHLQIFLTKYRLETREREGERRREREREQHHVFHLLSSYGLKIIDGATTGANRPPCFSPPFKLRAEDYRRSNHRSKSPTIFSPPFKLRAEDYRRSNHRSKSPTMFSPPFKLNGLVAAKYLDGSGSTCDEQSSGFRQSSGDQWREEEHSYQLLLL